MKEIWRANPRFPLYEVSSEGRVRRAIANGHGQRVGRISKPLFRPQTGYVEYSLYDAEPRQRFVRANRLVCETFHGPAPSAQHEAAHIDNDPTNNRADNVVWKTHAENEEQKTADGRRPTKANGLLKESSYQRFRVNGRFAKEPIP